MSFTQIFLESKSQALLQLKILKKTWKKDKWILKSRSQKGQNLMQSFYFLFKRQWTKISTCQASDLHFKSNVIANYGPLFMSIKEKDPKGKHWMVECLAITIGVQAGGGESTPTTLEKCTASSMLQKFDTTSLFNRHHKGFSWQKSQKNFSASGRMYIISLLSSWSPKEHKKVISF